MLPTKDILTCPSCKKQFLFGRSVEAGERVFASRVMFFNVFSLFFLVCASTVINRFSCGLYSDFR